MGSFTTLWLAAIATVAAAASQKSARHHGTDPWVRDFDNLVAFGDSYTDESRLGYFFQHNGAAPPPGLLLPPSNSTPGGGITWDRWVALDAGVKLYNYAVSGAVCSNEIIYRYLSGIQGPFPDVVYEVNAFIADTKYINASTNTNTLYTDRQRGNTVYSMWIGTNDLGVGAFLTDSSLNGTTIPDYVDCIYDRFDQIYSTGGRYFVLMNTAPLQLSPLYGMPPYGLTASHYWNPKPANISEVSGKMKEYTQLVNDIFNYRTPFELLVARRYPGASIAIFDTNRLLTDIYNDPTAFGFPSPTNVTGQYYLCDPVTGGNCTSQTQLGLDHFLWYDELHPSEQTDKVIAREFIEVVKGGSKYATYWG